MTTRAKERVFVVGVGMTKFEKPGGRAWDYPDMAREAGQAALQDSGVAFTEIQQICCGCMSQSLSCDDSC